MMYEIVIPIRVGLAGPADLGDVIDYVTDQLAVIDENTPALLDYAVSSDATDNTVSFELTVDAEDQMEALAGAVSWVRAAFHAAGGATPGWAVRDVDNVSVQALTVPC
jgi:hypothetical protein